MTNTTIVADAASPQPTVQRPVVSNWTRSTRETIESIAIAFAMAFLFKSFEAEAFVIPTGSMAPTLMGRHKDVICPECGFRYSASGSEEADREGNLRPGDQFQVVQCTCPVCRFPMSVDPQNEHNVGRNANPSYSGDRIWVSKVPYQFMEPRRWDVAVFRYPEEAETYYIKRLIGLPNEIVKIHHGDIYTKGSTDGDFVIQRKPPDKVRAMAQIVHNNDYASPELAKLGWPLWWRPRETAENTRGTWHASEDARTYATDGSADNETWIRYQHVVPSANDWFDITEGRWSAGAQHKPQLITDFYAFNTRVLRQERGPMPSALGLHWVGDLILDCDVDVQSASGSVLLDLVQGGRHFRCDIDVANGQAELTIPGLDDWRRTASTAVRGVGHHRVMFANVDRQLLLWIDGRAVDFDKPATYDSLGNDRPVSTEADAGDLAPLGIGSRGAALQVNHLRVLRDIYYIADDNPHDHAISDYRGTTLVPNMDNRELAEFLSSPRQWQDARGRNIFDARQDAEFPLAKDQFFMLGDNSPSSFDARLWSTQHYVERELLVGKALFVYWPHALNLFIPFTDVALPIVPNFPDMGFIR